MMVCFVLISKYLISVSLFIFIVAKFNQIDVFSFLEFAGQVVLDTPLLLKNDRSCKIFSIKPIAVSASEEVQMEIKGLNISRSNTRYHSYFFGCMRHHHFDIKDVILSLNVFSWTWELFSAFIKYMLSYILLFRLLCALEGKYLVQQDSSSLMDGAASSTDNEEIQSISFPCSIPDIIGRGFIEVTSLPLFFLCSQHVQSFSFILCKLWSEHFNLLVRLIGALYL